TCGERKTVKIFLRVGRAMGPVTTAPVLRTVFTIFSADLSTRLWSYDCNLILILCDICRFPFLERERKDKGAAYTAKTLERKICEERTKEKLFQCIDYNSRSKAVIIVDDFLRKINVVC